VDGVLMRLTIRTLRRLSHFKTIARAAIPVWRRHAADEEQLLRPNALRVRIKKVLTQMQPFDQTDHDAIVADIQRAPLGVSGAKCQVSGKGGDRSAINLTPDTPHLTLLSSVFVLC
jgi:hypothetical protein